jgi:hypothetical protein
MNRPLVLAVVTAVAATIAVPALVTPAQAQIEVQIGTPQPPAYGAWGDRDRDGVPNAYDRYNNNRQGAWGDRDRDGVPNAYDRYNNNRQQAWGDRDRDGVPNRYDTDRDGDGVPNTWDRNPANPYRR